MQDRHCRLSLKGSRAGGGGTPPEMMESIMATAIRIKPIAKNSAEKTFCGIHRESAR